VTTLIIILKLILVIGVTAGWNERKRSKNPSPRYWYQEEKFRQDSVIRKLDSTVYVFKLRKL
jgi:hypothetical protein